MCLLKIHLYRLFYSSHELRSYPFIVNISYSKAQLDCFQKPNKLDTETVAV